MKQKLIAAITMLCLTTSMFADDDVVGALSGTVRRIDSATKTFVVETDQGAKHTFHYTEEVTVDGSKDVAKTPEETLKGLTIGGEVAVHYTVKGTVETAHEVDVLGDHVFKISKGTITGLDRGSKFIVIKTADGTEETFRLSERAAKDSGKGIAKGTEKTAKVTVYYTGSAAKKVAHFFEY